MRLIFTQFNSKTILTKCVGVYILIKYLIKASFISIIANRFEVEMNKMLIFFKKVLTL